MKRVVSREQLAEAIRRHGAWLRGEAEGRRANLSCANLSRANLSVALYDTKTLWPEFQIVPDSGPFWLWKLLSNDIIAHLEVPAEAARVSSTGRKCRAEFARVLGLFAKDGTPLPANAVGRSVTTCYAPVEYRRGEIVRPDKWDPDFRVECAPGIHGFLRRAEAEAY